MFWVLPVALALAQTVVQVVHWRVAATMGAPVQWRPPKGRAKHTGSRRLVGRRPIQDAPVALEPSPDRGRHLQRVQAALQAPQPAVAPSAVGCPPAPARLRADPVHRAVSAGGWEGWRAPCAPGGPARPAISAMGACFAGLEGPAGCAAAHVHCALRDDTTRAVRAARRWLPPPTAPPAAAAGAACATCSSLLSSLPLVCAGLTTVSSGSW